MWQFFKPVAISVAQTLLSAGSEVIKKSATVKDVIMSTVEPTVVAMLDASVDLVISFFNSLRCEISMTLNCHLLHPLLYLKSSKLDHIGSVAARLYIRKRQNVLSIPLTSNQLFIIF